MNLLFRILLLMFDLYCLQTSIYEEFMERNYIKSFPLVAILLFTQWHCVRNSKFCCDDLMLCLGPISQSCFRSHTNRRAQQNYALKRYQPNSNPIIRGLAEVGNVMFKQLYMCILVPGHGLVNLRAGWKTAIIIWSEKQT